MPVRQKTQEEHRKRVLAVLAYVREHGLEDLSLDQLANVAYQSPFHFDRVFQAQTGMPPMQHVKQFRLIQAAIQLRLTQRKIIEIAQDAGYARPESFSRAFRSFFGVSPSRFRKQALAHIYSRRGLEMHNFEIGLVKIPVTDFAAATKYYREVVGLEEEFAVEAYGWAQYKTGNLPLCLYVTGQGGGDGTPGEEIGFHLQVDQIESFYDEFNERGGRVGSEIVKSSDGGMFFMLCDLDNNRFKVGQMIR